MKTKPPPRVLRLLLVLGIVALVVVTAAPGGGGGGGGGGDSIWGICLLPLLPVLVVGWALAYLFKKPLQLIEIILVLPGEKVIDRLDLLLTGADFSTPHGRGNVLRQLLASITAEDIREACLRIHYISKLELSHVSRAKTIYRARMSTAGLAERPASEVVAARATAQPSPTCLLGILTTLGGDHPVAEGSKATVQTLLATLRSGSTAGPAVLYLYYAPDPGKQLTEKQAQLLLQSFAGAAT